jgi:AraC family transcriptional regulator
MVNYRLVERPAFDVLGKQTWIAGTDDNEAFGRFWEQCGAEGLFTIFEQIGGMQPGPQTNGVTLGISRVAQDPSNRAFYYMIAIERPQNTTTVDLECYRVPATHWAVFECRGPVPEAIVAAEMYAFGEWLLTSGHRHAAAPEMEVYPPNSKDGRDDNHYCEFWLPITPNK